VDTVIEHKAQLIETIALGAKPRKSWSIGTEHEEFLYCLKNMRRLPYKASKNCHTTISQLFDNLIQEGWKGVTENDQVIALTNGSGRITLEPGGQVELSGASFETLHAIKGELEDHLNQLKRVSKDMGIIIVPTGVDPYWSRNDIPWMPKERYTLMRQYMQTKGLHGLDMMKATCSVQVNLDFEEESDMVKKFRVGLALQPIIAALFANSPILNKHYTGFQSMRNFIWMNTDPDRCGLLPFVFEEGMGFERYVDYILDVPMYFVHREGRHINALGQSFRSFLKGKLPALPGVKPTLKDWENHLTTVFPEVRMKKYLEFRSVDAGKVTHNCALPALWVGLLYDQDNLDELHTLVQDWSEMERHELYASSCRHGLKTKIRNQTIGEFSKKLLNMARHGLDKRNHLNRQGQNETIHLDYLDQLLSKQQTQAQYYTALFNGELKRDTRKLLKTMAI